MRRVLSVLSVLALATVALSAVTAAQATHGTDSHSQNTAEVGSVDLGGSLGDIAFWGNLAIVSRLASADGLGATDGFSVVDISNPQSPREISRFPCTSAGRDVSVWEDLVFLSTDSFTQSEDETCSSATGFGFVGLKIVSIADPAQPFYVGSVWLPCGGSHTSTIVPDLANSRVLIYASSLYASSLAAISGAVAPGPCDSIVEVPLADPTRAAIIGTLPHGELRSPCHDQTAFLPRKLLAAACGDEFRLYDISEPAEPELISIFVQPGVLQHGAAFSNDGNSLVTGEEGLFYDDPAACQGGTSSPHAAIWFYDITVPEAPVFHSYHQLQRGLEATSPEGAGGCGAHYFNVVPTRSDRDILTIAWYAGGMSAVDFTDLDAPTEIAYYQPGLSDPSRRAHYWSAYWYRGHVYATNWYRSQRHSLDVYAISDPAIGDTYLLPHLNPQSQEALIHAPVPPSPAPIAPPRTEFVADGTLPLAFTPNPARTTGVPSPEGCEIELGTPVGTLGPPAGSVCHSAQWGYAFTNATGLPAEFTSGPFAQPIVFGGDAAIVVYNADAVGDWLGSGWLVCQLDEVAANGSVYSLGRGIVIDNPILEGRNQGTLQLSPRGVAAGSRIRIRMRMAGGATSSARMLFGGESYGDAGITLTVGHLESS